MTQCSVGAPGWASSMLGRHDSTVRCYDISNVHSQAPIPYPTAIFIREKALVVNVEGIRMIICADQILILSVPDPLHPNTGILPPLRHPFVKELVSRCVDSGLLWIVHLQYLDFCTPTALMLLGTQPSWPR